MRFYVEQWAPEYGSPMEQFDAEQDAGAEIDAGVELGESQWRAVEPKGEPAAETLFIDGVRRIEARVWIEAEGRQDLALCASVAAGSVRCGERAVVESTMVERCLVGPSLSEGIQTRHGFFGPNLSAGSDPADLMNRLAEALSSLEIEVAEQSGAADLVVVDGPLRGRERIDRAVGYVKSHRASYLGPSLNAVVASLAPGQRTPMFLFTTSWTRYSWYLRLPFGQGHPWAGIVRCEAPSTLSVPQAREVADLTAATLPRFASEPHKDSRAPQNLYPIAGLENRLRHMLGAQEVLYRALAVSGAAQRPSALAGGAS